MKNDEPQDELGDGLAGRTTTLSEGGNGKGDHLLIAVDKSNERDEQSVQKPRMITTSTLHIPRVRGSSLGLGGSTLLGG